MSLKLWNGKISAAFITIFFLITLTVSQTFADPFMNYPGARAKAMGGAFTGIADDASAAWYNPAGLAGQTHGLTLERSQVATIETESGPLSTNSSAWFMGGKFCLDEFGVGLFYAEPYSVKYWAYEQSKNDWAWGKVNEAIQTLSVPFAVSFFDGWLNLGGSLEWVHLGIDGSAIKYKNNEGIPREYPVAKKSTSGFSGSIGTLITHYDREPIPYKLKFGAVYRLKSSSDIGGAAMRADSDKAVAQLFFDKPESFDLGLSLTREFIFIESELTLAAQYGTTDWGGARKEDWEIKYKKISFGLEYLLISETAFIKRTAFRIGTYTSKPSDHGMIWNWPDAKGITYGIGILIGDIYDSFRFDVTQEQKSLKNNDGLNDTANLTSFALTWSF